MENESSPKTADSNVLDIGRCGGATSPASESDPTISPSCSVVKHFSCRPSIVPRERIAAHAVKAASRAQRGRSETSHTRSALSARVASRTMTARRPTDLHAFNTVWMHESDDEPLRLMQ